MYQFLTVLEITLEELQLQGKRVARSAKAEEESGKP